MGQEVLPEVKNIKLESDNSEESKKTESEFEEELLAAGAENVLICSLKSPFKGLQIDPLIHANR